MLRNRALHHVTTGGPGLPLVLLHGAGGSTRHWQWVVAALPTWITPISIDLPGHGDSPGTVMDTVEETAAAVLDLVLSRFPGRRFAVAGHSLGGLVALRLAISAPARVSHLGLVATAARVLPHPELLRQLVTGRPDPAFIGAAFSGEVPAHRVEVVVEDMRRTRMAPDARDFMSAGELDLSAELDRVTARTVVMIADRDPVISPRRSRSMAAAIAGARTVVLGGGHYLHVERPADVARELVTTLEGERR